MTEKSFYSIGLFVIPILFLIIFGTIGVIIAFITYFLGICKGSCSGLFFISNIGLFYAMILPFYFFLSIPVILFLSRLSLRKQKIFLLCLPIFIVLLCCLKLCFPLVEDIVFGLYVKSMFYSTLNKMINTAPIILIAGYANIFFGYIVLQFCRKRGWVVPDEMEESKIT